MKLTKDLNNNDIEINEEILIKIDWQKILQDDLTSTFEKEKIIRDKLMELLI